MKTQQQLDSRPLDDLFNNNDQQQILDRLSDPTEIRMFLRGIREKVTM